MVGLGEVRRYEIGDKARCDKARCMIPSLLIAWRASVLTGDQGEEELCDHGVGGGFCFSRLVKLVVFGVGLNWGAVALKVEADPIDTLLEADQLAADAVLRTGCQELAFSGEVTVALVGIDPKG